MDLLRKFYKKAPSEVKGMALNTHGTARYLTNDAFQVNLIEFHYRKLRTFNWEDGQNTLQELETLITGVELPNTSPAALLLLKSLAPLLNSHASELESKYSTIYNLLIKSPIKDKQSVDPKVTIKLDHHQRKVLPKKDARNILITSALPYVNNVPHLGNIIGCVLSADVYARYCRTRGYNTLYVCGTDEYGTATETKAIEEKVSCQELCDKYHALHRQTYNWFGIDCDIFDRTTTQKQTEISQAIYHKLNDHGFIFEEATTQLYCEQHKSFLADRFVEGTCPLCGYEDARGDQCDKCGKLLNAVDLINPHCKLDGATPITKDSNHLFLNLTDAQPSLESWFKKASVEGSWSSNSETITSSWLKEGLKPRCITRDLKWGTPVPRPGFEDKVFYVWFDAPIGYLSITATYTDEWEKWWKNPQNVKLYQFLGKDNVPFHTVLFPSTLIGTKENWTLLHHLSTTEYLQYETGKFSKSRGVGVFGNNVMDSKIPVEVWRYYLLSQRPESHDSQFTWDGFQAANNNELLANLGNLVNRLVKFVNAKYDGELPPYTLGDPEKNLVEKVNVLLANYIETMEDVKIRQGVRVFMDISSLGNQYLQENKIDNTLFAENRSRCDTVVSVAANLCYLLSALIYPYIPTTSEAILRMLKLPQRRITDTWTGTDIVTPHQIGEAEYLFKRIDDKKIDECRRLYSGKAVVAEPESKKKKQSKNKEVKLPEVLTPEMKELNDKVNDQGLLVRNLKVEKADANEIKKAVDTLLDLKKKLNELIVSASK